MFSGINHGSNTVVPTPRVCVSNLRTRSTSKARQLDLPVGLALRLLSDSTLHAVEILEPIPFSSGPYSMGCSRHMTIEFEECKPHAGSYSGTSANLSHFELRTSTAEKYCVRVMYAYVFPRRVIRRQSWRLTTTTTWTWPAITLVLAILRA